MGRQRNPTDWTTFAPGTEPVLLTGRGYTGHSLSRKAKRFGKHLPVFGLINMNGRLYDPVLGRFLNPDMNVQAPDNSQSYNRYSYCMNNPMLYADISGNTWFTNLGDWLGNAGKIAVVIGVSIAVSAAVIASCGTLAPLAIAVIAGAVSGLAGNMVNTAFSGGSGNDFLHAAVNGIVGGAISGLVGGAVGKWAVKGLKSFGINAINSPVLKSALAGGITGSGVGFVGSFASEFALSGGDVNAALKAGIKGAAFGFGIGLASGAYMGYKTAIDNHIDPWTGERTDVLAKFYPDNDGAAGNWKTEILKKGIQIDRYGNPDGNYFAPKGTPIEMRSLPYDANTNSYSIFEVVKPFPVQSSIVAPAFNGMGLGLQYRTSGSTLFLLQEGYLKIIK